MPSFNDGALWIAVTTFFLGYVSRFAVGYLSKKGENLAMKEDLQEITRTVESIKTQNTLFVEALKAQNTLRFAAVERRLQAHQEAYTQWRGLLSKLSSNDLPVQIKECEQWWEKNCIFLERQASEAFQSAYFRSASHRQLKYDGASARELRDCFQEIQRAGDVIRDAVELPILKDSRK